MLTEERMKIISELVSDPDYMKKTTPRIENRCSETDIDVWIEETKASIRENRLSDFIVLEK